MHPFLKWPGGKRWLVANYHMIFPKKFNAYFEPFLGGGAAFFHLMPQEATISDINSDLINTYRIMAKHPQELRISLEAHQASHSNSHYYSVRKNIPTNAIERAARFLYLNRTCFNGMYRVNQKGFFNVPIGTCEHFVDDVELFDEYARVLRRARIHTKDFVDAIRDASDSDLVFVDPPYTLAHSQNSFIKYNEKLFSWRDQSRLLNALIRARNRGAIIVATNARCPELEHMYQDNGFYLHRLSRYSSISGSVTGRGRQEELLVTSYPLSLD